MGGIDGGSGAQAAGGNGRSRCVTVTHRGWQADREERAREGSTPTAAALRRPSPADGAVRDLQDRLILVDGEGLVARPKVEDPALAHLPDGVAAEPLAVGPALLQHHLRRVRVRGTGPVPRGGKRLTRSPG